MKNFGTDYESPVLSVIEIYPEEVLCGSNEFVGENEGEW